MEKLFDITERCAVAELDADDLALVRKAYWDLKDVEELKQHFYELSYALDSHSAGKEYEELRRTHYENIDWMENKGLEEEYYKVFFEHIKNKGMKNDY